MNKKKENGGFKKMLETKTKKIQKLWKGQVSTKAKKKRLIMVSGSVLLAAIIVTSTFAFVKGAAFGRISIGEAETRLQAYIEDTLAGVESEIDSLDYSRKEGLFEIELNVGGTDYTSYMSKNGQYLFPSGISLEQYADVEVEKKAPSLGIPQSDVPDVKLFVMSYCPFGLQMEKAYLPAWDLLKDEADMGLYFVDYIMHDKEEIDENVRQYCIGEESEELLVDYLGCFVVDGDYEGCLTGIGMSDSDLASCVEDTDSEYAITANYEDKDSWLNGRYPMFEIHGELNDEYGVSGSPTLVINGEVVQTERSPEAIKEAVCQAFTNMPDECDELLTDVVPSAGFGGGTGSSNGSCG